MLSCGHSVLIGLAHRCLDWGALQDLKIIRHDARQLVQVNAVRLRLEAVRDVWNAGQARLTVEVVVIVSVLDLLRILQTEEAVRRVY